MTNKSDQDELNYERWARFRFSVVGSLLAAPPKKSQLRSAIELLANRDWHHPITEVPVRFAFSTIERWYYQARKGGIDPVSAVTCRIRKHRGTHPSLNEAVRKVLNTQYSNHRRWSIKLHYDNLNALARGDPSLGSLPSYSVVRRYMKEQGLRRAKGRRIPKTKGAELAVDRFEKREVRSYESEYVASLYHIDFHECSRSILAPNGEWKRPKLYGCLCDRSRLVCHLQWYWSESAQTFAHGTQQAFMKRGLPRIVMTDRGAAELSLEAKGGMSQLGIDHRPTLPYSPYQNAKKEVFWGVVEGRLMAMLDGVTDLTLAQLNRATQAWVDQDYNREIHREIKCSPLDRWLEGPTVVRECPGPQILRNAFRRTVTRRQRKSDGTVTINGTRFEVPSNYGHHDELSIRYANWDLTNVHLFDRRQKKDLAQIWPQDKVKNSEGRRANRQGPSTSERGTPLAPPVAVGFAPLLQEYLNEMTIRGVSPAYLPLKETIKKGIEGK